MRPWALPARQSHKSAAFPGRLTRYLCKEALYQSELIKQKMEKPNLLMVPLTSAAVAQLWDWGEASKAHTVILKGTDMLRVPQELTFPLPDLDNGPSSPTQATSLDAKAWPSPITRGPGLLLPRVDQTESSLLLAQQPKSLRKFLWTSCLHCELSSWVVSDSLRPRGL